MSIDGSCLSPATPLLPRSSWRTQGMMPWDCVCELEFMLRGFFFSISRGREQAGRQSRLVILRASHSHNDSSMLYIQLDCAPAYTTSLNHLNISPILQDCCSARKLLASVNHNLADWNLDQAILELAACAWQELYLFIRSVSPSIPSCNLSSPCQKQGSPNLCQFTDTHAAVAATAACSHRASRPSFMRLPASDHDLHFWSYMWIGRRHGQLKLHQDGIRVLVRYQTLFGNI